MTRKDSQGTYEAIPRMYAYAALVLSSLDDLITIEICRRMTKIDSKWRA